MLKRLAVFAAAASLFLSSSSLAQDLGVGDPAPPIQVEKWVKGDAVAAFAKNKVYVVEFWATWCGPCRVSIPHISELQRKYKEKNVSIVGVSIWERDQAKVEPFVTQMGDKMAYAVAMDGDKGAMAKSWMEAAGQDGIPTAFIVNGEGKIAWIGYPMEMDEPLAQVVAGKWDVAEAKKKAREAKELQPKAEELGQKLEAPFEKKDWKTVVALIDEAVAATPALEELFGTAKFTALFESKSYDKAYAYGDALVRGPLKKNARALNEIAWRIVDPDATGIEKRDLKLALRAAERAVELTEGKAPEVLDTLAVAHFQLGDVKKAIEVQEKAVALAKGTPMEKELAGRLETFKKAAQKPGY